MSREIFFKNEINNIMEWNKGIENPLIYSFKNYNHNIGLIGRQVSGIEQVINFPPNEVNETFTKLVNRIIKYKLLGIDFFTPNYDYISIQKVIREYKKGNPQPIDYDKYWLAFNQNYFLKNLYKAFVTIKYLRSKDLIKLKTNLTVIDVGCGAGVCTIAWSRLFDNCANKIILIDRNKSQLELAKQIIRTFGSNKFEFRNISFPQEFDQLNGIRLFSYFFCEQEDYDILFNSSNLSKIVGEGAVIIDYQYIIDNIVDRLNPTFKFTRWKIKLKEVPSILVEKNKKEQYIYGAYIKP